jgi:hypothetical protein
LAISSPYLTVDAAGNVRTATGGSINFEETGPTLVLYIRLTDKGGLTLVKMFTVLVNNLAEKPTSNAITCYCDEDRISSKSPHKCLLF